MENTEIKENSNKLSLPIAIVVAGVLIAGAILITKMPTTVQAPTDQPGTASSDLKNLVPISQKDHIFGAGPENKIFIVEFSDTECPFCKRFHPTMKKIVSDYNGQVAWVYRHFPLDSIHSRARKEAQATECATELGGNDGFWKYLDRLYEITPSNNQLDPAELYNIAKDTGLDETAFKTCLDSGKYAGLVEAQSKDGISIGVTGTPMSIIIYKDKKVLIEGAEPYEAVKAKIDTLLK